MSKNFEEKFYLVFHDPHLRHRIFYHRRPADRRASGDWAARLNYFEAIHYAPCKMHFTSVAIDWAAECGHLEMLHWLDKNESFEHFKGMAVVSAAKNGHFEVVKWLCENRYTTDYFLEELARDVASECGYPEIVDFLQSRINS